MPSGIAVPTMKLFHDDGIGVASRRLSIVGLADGHQPLTNEDGSVVTVFNGELFDFPETKAVLESKGHRFAIRLGEQGARSPELRAPISRARLKLPKPKRVGTRQPLEDAYNSFSEGFDTPDLRVAEALLLASD
jgi:hypothetical protein